MSNVASKKVVDNTSGSGVYNASEKRYQVLWSIFFIIVSIILSIILGAIKKHIRKRHKIKKPGAISRLFGFVIGAGVGVIWAVIVVWIFSFLGGVPFFKDFLGEYLYKTNYVNMLISWITSLF